MFLDRRTQPVYPVLGLALALASCSSGSSTGLDAGPGADAATNPGADATVNPGADATVNPDATGPVVEFPESRKKRVHFKRQGRLMADFAAALELAPNAVCKELDRFDCFTQVHAIPLGGVEPYQLGLYDPLPNTTKSTPIAAERIALLGCRNRVDLDSVAGESAVIWKGIRTDGDGKLADRTQPEIDAALGELYQRFALRDAQPSELTALRALYDDVIAEAEPQPARAWAILACFAVATSVESLFY